MPTTFSDLLESLPLEVQAEIDDACERLERAWQTGPRPELSSFLGDEEGPTRLALLYELISSDRDQAHLAGEACDLEYYRPWLTAAEFEALAPHFDSGSAPCGPQIPNYEILGEINEGWEGVVYRAKQRTTDRIVALKIVKAGRDAAPDERARLRREVQAVRRLDHPNVVRVLDHGEHDQVPYFVMEYLEGGDLSTRLESERLTQRQTVQLMLTLANAMEYVHRQHIVHRDLKPANVLLTQQGEPKIADFGFAKRLMLDPKRTRLPGEQTGEIVGSICYMAPEQANGDFRKISPATDTHALGTIFYELLTGEPPFRNLDEVKFKEPLLPSQLAPSVSEAVEAVCMKCLEKDPEERYRSASELAEDLRRILQGLRISIPTLSVWERREHWCRQAGYDQLEVVTIGPRDIVYKAREKHLQRSVILKVLSNLTDPSAREQFRAEVSQLAGLQHPNIVQTYSSGERNGRPYVVMEFVEGKNFHEEFGDRPVSPAQAAELVGKLADAIQYAHDHQVIHCALKPSNVLLQTDGSPKITNFGSLAQVAHPELPLDKPVLRPLPYYLAPEVVEGRVADIGPATDTYSLGACLYQLLTGRPPFVAETLEEIYENVREHNLVPPRQLQPNIPETLEAVCLRALHFDPEDRYSRAEELARDLRLKEVDTKEFDLLPGYRILDLIGRGGLGLVYRAEHVGLGVPVAVKFFDKLERSLLNHMREARRTMARIHHPNLLTIRDGGTQDGILYTVEELAEGTNLELLSEQGSLSIPQIVQLFRQIAEALDYAHGFQVIHRNLKPRVILFTEAGVPKISSFELAKLPQLSAVETMLHFIGTPMYCAPEQFARDPDLIVVETDVYAVGAILYKALTGSDPYQGESWDELEEKIRAGSVRPLHELRADIPGPLQAICTKCLQTNPSDRFRSAGELAQALAALL